MCSVNWRQDMLGKTDGWTCKQINFSITKPKEPCLPVRTKNTTTYRRERIAYQQLRNGQKINSVRIEKPFKIAGVLGFAKELKGNHFWKYWLNSKWKQYVYCLKLLPKKFT